MTETYDAILLPTGETSFGDKSFPVSQKAVDLFNSGRFGCIFVTGGYNGFSRVTPGESESEADETAKYLFERGIPREKVYSDSQSLETIGNFTFPLVQPMEGNPNLSEFEKILVVGKEGHLWRVKDYSTLVFDRTKSTLDFHAVPGRHNDGLLARTYHHAIMHSLKKLMRNPCAEKTHSFILENHPFYSENWYSKSLTRRKAAMASTILKWVL